MNTFLTVLISIVEIILILAVLISLHELGHLAMAKLFRVYCFEYSIGFGPKLFRRKRKKGETYFAIRALPLGGYVSMYGEAESVPEDFAGELDPSRSLPEKKKWQQALIMVAGVTVNFILGLILIFVSNIAFPVYSFAYGIGMTETTNSLMVTANPIASFGNSVISAIDAEIAAKPQLNGYQASDFYLCDPLFYDETIKDTRVQVVYLDDHATIDESPNTFAAAYYPSTLIENHSIAKSVLFYDSTADMNGFAYSDAFASVGFTRRVSDDVIDPTSSTSNYLVSNANDGIKVQFHLRLLAYPKDEELRKNISITDLMKDYTIKIPYEMTVKNHAWTVAEENDIVIGTVSEFLGWNRAWGRWAQDVPNACGAIVQGIGGLFTGGWKNLSGIVGMTAALPALTARGGAHQIFYFAGLLSINLAFFNLLPFPGLDGWQLVSIAFEAITRKRIPTKVKAIISYVGLGLLFLLVIAITVKDIIALF